jgi:hypothetical protein
MRGLLLALLFLPLAAFGADGFHPPTPGELAMKDVPWAPGAPAVILEWSVTHDDEESQATEYVRIKVLTEAGRTYADVGLLSIPRHHAVKAIDARTTNGTNPPVPFDRKVYDKIVARRGRVRLLQKTFTLPDVQVGSILEYRYTVTWPSGQLRTARWTLQREIPILKATFSIRPSHQLSSAATTKGLPPDVVPVRSGDRYHFTLEKVAAYVEEPFAPPELEAKPRLQFFYTSGKASEYWTGIGFLSSVVVEEFIGKGSGIRKAAAQIAGNAQDADAKLRALYRHVQTLRNLTFEPDKTEQQAKREKLRAHDRAEDVLRAGYGTRNELNRLFVALARAAGFDAGVALVAARDDVFFTRERPDATQLEDELAAVTIDGAERFFDPGTPHAPFGLLSWENTAVPALRLRAGGGGTWVPTPTQTHADARTLRSADLELREGKLAGIATITYHGQEALAKRLAALHDDEAATRKNFEEELKTLFPAGSSVTLTKMDALKGVDEPLAIHFEIELPNVVSETASRTLVPLSIFTAAALNPFAAEKRLYPVYFPYHHQVEDRVTVRLPDGYAVESLPKPVTINAGSIEYGAAWKSAADAVTFERRRTIKTIAIAAAEYKTLRNVFGDAANADQQPVVLKKTGL